MSNKDIITTMKLSFENCQTVPTISTYSIPRIWVSMHTKWYQPAYMQREQFDLTSFSTYLMLHKDWFWMDNNGNSLRDFDKHSTCTVEFPVILLPEPSWSVLKWRINQISVQGWLYPPVHSNLEWNTKRTLHDLCTLNTVPEINIQPWI